MSDLDTFPKRIKHTNGETILASKPLRVAAMNFVAAEYLLTLGVVPYASTSLSTLAAFPLYQHELSDHSIIDLGLTPNEDILAANPPDLIIAFDWDKSDYDKCSAIAPTVVFGSKGDISLLDTYINPLSEALGETEAKDAFIARYESVKSEARASVVRAGLAGATALFLMMSSTTIYIYTGWTTKLYYEELGFALCLGLEGKTVMKWEELLRCDPDLLFVAKLYVEQEDRRASLMDHPVWKQLKAVKAGSVFEMDASMMGPLARGQLHGASLIRDMLHDRSHLL